MATDIEMISLVGFRPGDAPRGFRGLKNDGTNSLRNQFMSGAETSRSGTDDDDVRRLIRVSTARGPGIPMPLIAGLVDRVSVHGFIRVPCRSARRFAKTTGQTVLDKPRDNGGPAVKKIKPVHEKCSGGKYPAVLFLKKCV